MDLFFPYKWPKINGLTGFFHPYKWCCILITGDRAHLVGTAESHATSGVGFRFLFLVRDSILATFPRQISVLALIFHAYLRSTCRAPWCNPHKWRFSFIILVVTMASWMAGVDLMHTPNGFFVGSRSISILFLLAHHRHRHDQLDLPFLYIWRTDHPSVGKYQVVSNPYSRGTLPYL